MDLETTIPTVDLSPFFEEGNESGRKKAIEKIGRACTGSGFFQIVNHGVPPALMARALELSKTFFQHPDHEKTKWRPADGSPLPAGYNRQPLHSSDKNEYLLMFVPAPGSELASLNVYPDDPPEFRYALFIALWSIYPLQKL
ncbi:hypothetical protein ACLOJK_029049 [Asimina triloba]